MPKFLSTPSARRATVTNILQNTKIIISIHALREEGDSTSGNKHVITDGFLSTPSARRATRAKRCNELQQRNFYPRPPRGGRHVDTMRAMHRMQFLSTPSARRATPQVVTSTLSLMDFYPRPPRGGRQHSISKSSGRYAFLSTPSARRATGSLEKSRLFFFISIHALREEGDKRQTRTNSTLLYFYPRPPRGGRLLQETAPIDIQQISIHALREEGDVAKCYAWVGESKFLSTPSARRATAKTERKHPAFVSLYTSLHKLQRDVCKPNRKITPLLAQTAGIPVRSVPENHVCCRFALAGHQKISTLSWANSGCSPTCSTLVW